MVSIERTEGSEVTVLSCDPRFDAEAERLRERFFPGAEIRGKLPDEVGVRIVLGADFIDRNETQLANFRTAHQFMWARTRGELDRARGFLSDEAAAQFDRHEGGLALEGYLEPSWNFTPTGVLRGDDITEIVFLHRGFEGGRAYEKLTVGGSSRGARPQVLQAERNL